MAAHYYHLDPDGKTVHGPFGMRDMWALADKGIVTSASLVAREGGSAWLVLATVPELQAHLTEGGTNESPRTTREVVVMMVMMFLMPIAGIVFGMIDAATPERRKGGMTFIALSILLMAVYYQIYVQGGFSRFF